MPLRSYDPTIARWNRIDPVLHHGLSTYNAFDNNPIVHADPSGGDAYNAHQNYENYLQPMSDHETRYLDHDFAVNGVRNSSWRGAATASNRGRDYAAAASAGLFDNNKNVRARNYGTNLIAALNDLGVSYTINNVNPYSTPDFLGISTTLDEVFIGSDPAKDIETYEENDRIMVRNSMILDVLGRFTNTGQLRSTMFSVIGEWRKATGIIVTHTEAEQMLMEIDEGLNLLGIVATTAVPELKIAATIIATPLMMDNIHRSTLNKLVYGPRIMEHSPYYYKKNIGPLPYKPHTGGSFGGGGASGSWD